MFSPKHPCASIPHRSRVSHQANAGGGGGGGSFVFLSGADMPMVVAGGGGGSSFRYYDTPTSWGTPGSGTVSGGAGFPGKAEQYSDFLGVICTHLCEFGYRVLIVPGSDLLKDVVCLRRCILGDLGLGCTVSMNADDAGLEFDVFERCYLSLCT